MRVLDLTALTSEETKKLNQIVETNKLNYVEFIDTLCETFKNDNYIWYTSLVSRNTEQSDTFRDICLLKLVDVLLKESDYDSVKVDKRSLAKVIRKKYKIKVICKEKSKYIIKTRMPIINAIKMLSLIKKRIDAVNRVTTHGWFPINKKNVVLVDNYIISSEFKDNSFYDRYFTGFEIFTNENLIYLDQLQFSSLEEGSTLANKVSKLKGHMMLEKFVCNDDFIEIKKYLLWACKFKVDRIKFGEDDVTEIINDSIRESISDLTTIYGIIKGNVINRLIDKFNLDIKVLIGWYEGQSSSNISFYKVRKRNSKITTIAYELCPFMENNLGYYPSKLQNIIKFAPEYFGIQGEGWLSNVVQFDKKTKVIIEPSFRYNSIFDIDIVKNRETKKRDILIVLPGNIQYCRQLLSDLVVSIKENDKKVFIKNHPLQENFSFVEYGIKSSDVKFDYEFINGNLREIAPTKELLIVSETTSVIEMLLSGSKVILYVPSGKICQTCLPLEKRMLCEIAFGTEELIAQIKNVPKEIPSVYELEELRNKCFTQSNSENCNAFINCLTVLN